MKKDQNINNECFDCPLPDCFPTDPRCPILRSKAESAGLTLPEAEKDVFRRRPGRPRIPFEYLNRADYQKKYKWNCRRILLKGVKIRRTDIEILRSVCEGNGRTLEEELVILIEEMADRARAKGGQ